ncbi:MAG TPA: family 1 glycosylhydrolase, partial [Polyangiaceae bacterium]|nr:family 1 glycosylhydrolase [Polyangiaceae bacterium]
MRRLRDLGIEPIVGLVHHGSGPLHTHLLDPEFPSELAAHARNVAERYPWVKYFTPVNEPLTTARFSALYGHWYPHARDAASFARALLTEVRATTQAMAAIRCINPDAELVQTEDLGTIFASEAVAYQADFENQRRWLGLDLLYGRVDSNHPLFGYLTRVAGVTPAELKECVLRATPADLLGINYYVTSDRFLDERIHHYPPELHGTNGRDVYADVEAVRVYGPGIAGHREVLELAWERYRTKLAITEVHLGCSEDEQVLWLEEAWQGAKDAVQAGVDVQAVTAWALFGAFDWNSLVTREDGHYEPGAFDVRSSPPRRTAVGEAIRHLASGASPTQAGKLGWWRRPERLSYPVFQPSLEVSGVTTIDRGTARELPAQRRAAQG